MEAYDDFVTCRICLGWYQSPKRLPCPHSYCLVCLQGIAQQGLTIQCPECKTQHVIPHGSVANFPSDVRLSSLVDKLKLDDTPIGANNSYNPTPKPQPKLTKEKLRERLAILRRRVPSEALTERLGESKEKWIQCNIDVENVRRAVNNKIDNLMDKLQKRRMELLTQLDPIELQAQQMTADLDDVQELENFCSEMDIFLQNTDEVAVLELQIAQMTGTVEHLDRHLAMKVPRPEFASDNGQIEKAINSYGKIY